MVFYNKYDIKKHDNDNYNEDSVSDENADV